MIQYRQVTLDLFKEQFHSLKIWNTKLLGIQWQSQFMRMEPI